MLDEGFAACDVGRSYVYTALLLMENLSDKGRMIWGSTPYEG